MLNWTYACAHRRGIDHINENLPCQDAVVIREDDNCIVAALADGLGSLTHSDIAAQKFTEWTAKWFQANALELRQAATTDTDKHLLSKLIPMLQERMKHYITEHALPENEVDCNLAFVCILKTTGPSDLFYAGRLGDCAVCLIGEKMEAQTSSVSVSAFTHTVMGSTATKNIHFTRGSTADGCTGFILTSDGLDNEIYMKGSELVLKTAENYYNAVFESRPKEALTSLLEAADPNCFTDDMSIAVISAESQPQVFPKEPRWLCTCGHHNRLTTSRCIHCGEDFLKLYKNVDFRPSKVEYFLDLNQDPEREARAIGITVPTLPAAEPEPDIIWSNANTAQQPARNATSGSGITTRNVAQAYKPHVVNHTSTSVPVTDEPPATRKHPHHADHTPEPPAVPPVNMIQNPSGNPDMPDPDSGRTPWGAAIILLSVCLLLTACTLAISVYDCFFRPTAPSDPAAVQQQTTEGIMLESGMVYYGPVSDGKPHGYGVVYNGDSAQFAYFIHGELIDQTAADFQSADAEDLVTLQQDLTLRSELSYRGATIAYLYEGNQVRPTGQENSADGIRWVEITVSGMTGWCNAEDLFGSEP